MNPSAREGLCRLLVPRDGVPPVPDKALWQAAVDEGVAACLWQRCRHDIDRRVTLPDDVRVELREHSMHLMLARQSLRTLLVGFAAAACPVICLRGQAVAQTVYDSPALRGQNDIDLLVMPHHVNGAAMLLRQAGYMPTPVYPMLFERGGMLVDLHVEPLGIERIRSWAYLTPLNTDDFFRHAVCGELEGQEALLLPLRLHLPYLCFHALKHSFERLIWLWDIALMSRRVTAEEGWDDLVAGMCAYRLERPCFYALSYVQEHLGASVPEHVLAAIRPRMSRSEHRLFERFMRHETVPFLAERLFARMMPNARMRAMFWYETVLPRREVRQQVSDTTEYGIWHFIRKRIRQLLTALVDRRGG